MVINIEESEDGYMEAYSCLFTLNMLTYPYKNFKFNNSIT
jgi:hypothetical protein